MGYVKLRLNTKLVFDPSYPNIDNNNFWEYWTDFYEGAVEALPPNTPSPRGKEMNLCMFIDSNHAGDKWTRLSRTGLMIYMIMAIINWYSERHSTIETSEFGTEFVAMKDGIETLCIIQYKLRMMGFLFLGPHMFMEITCQLSITSQNQSQY